MRLETGFGFIETYTETDSMNVELLLTTTMKDKDDEHVTGYWGMDKHGKVLISGADIHERKEFRGMLASCSSAWELAKELDRCDR